MDEVFNKITSNTQVTNGIFVPIIEGKYYWMLYEYILANSCDPT